MSGCRQREKCPCHVSPCLAMPRLPMRCRATQRQAWPSLAEPGHQTECNRGHRGGEGQQRKRRK